MTKNRIPRKLKKGMRTLNFNPPRTKWQRRAMVLIDKKCKAFADKINDGCNDGLTATIEVAQLIEAVHRARCKAIIK